jgi:site-specific DNA-methyltransferase (adenine-specific)
MQNSINDNSSFVNRLFHHDARDMSQIPDASVQLMITSPPYNVTKTYDQNLTLKEYLELLERVLRETYRVLKTTGFAAINIANVGRKPYIPLDCYIIDILHRIGFTIFQEIIWNKEASAGGSCAWGSWQSASNPSLRDVHEYIIIASKSPDITSIHCPLEPFSKFSQKIETKKIIFRLEDILSNIWAFQTESAKRVNHPAPFPVELPLRLIFLFSKAGDLILDPFIGSGSVALAALASKRNYTGFDINQEYIQITQSRILNRENTQKNKGAR